MATRPSEKPAWVPSNDPSKIVAPSASKKNTGWLQEEKPPFQYFNWFWNLLDQWIDYFGGYIRYNIVVDSVAEEADFSSLAAYISGTPVAGDRVLVKIDETITATLIIPAGVEITFFKGKKILVATNFSPMVTLSDGSALRGVTEIGNTDTGTIAQAVSINGDLAQVENLIVENVSSGTITTAFTIEAGKTNNLVRGVATNTGAGAITNTLTDSSTNVTNDIAIRDSSGIQAVIPPFIDTNPVVVGSADNTKKLRFEVDGFTTANTRVITPPDQNLTLGKHQEVDRSTSFDSAVATGTTIFPFDDNIPQNTDGDQYLSITHTPKNAANILKIEGLLHLYSTSAGVNISAALFQDAVANALKTGTTHTTTNAIKQVKVYHEMVAGGTALITFKIRAGFNSAGTTTFNGEAGVRRYGGTINSFIKVTECTP